MKRCVQGLVLMSLGACAAQPWSLEASGEDYARLGIPADDFADDVFMEVLDRDIFAIGHGRK